MKHIYKKATKIKYNNSLFQIIVRDDNQYGFLKIVEDGKEVKYEYPSAQEFLHLTSCLNPTNKIQF